MEYGCIGERLVHSFSKEIHSKLFNYSYELKELTQDEVGKFLTEREFSAINVTIPYKQTVTPFLDEIDITAEKIGAVNTIVNRNGRLVGYNTDFLGLKALIEKTGIEVSGKKVLILGSGGTSKTAREVAEVLGAKEILRVSRSGNDDCVTYEEAKEKHTDADIIINTTPSGMYPNNNTIPIDISSFPSLVGVVDVVYNPLRSQLVLSALERGIVAEGGLYMLVAQAVFAAELFTNTRIPKEKIDEVFLEIYNQKKNLILVGMPGSGKTTLGKFVAKDLNMPFVDTDDLIRDKSGKTAAEIIKESGEEFFRDVESAVIREISSKQGVVVATGGGAVLRAENRRALKENGMVVFLNRPLEKLAITSDRPLSSDFEKLKNRYEERYDIYCNSADVVINCIDDITENSIKIKDAFLNENSGN